MDKDKFITSEDINWYTDASANPQLGCGGINDSQWFIQQWDEEFIKEFEPSINYLELYAMTLAIYMWIHKYQNQRIHIFCDNMSVVQMVNNSSSKCRNCMVLIRFITIKALTHNVKIKVKHVPGKLNTYADWLSRMEYKKFKQHTRMAKEKFEHSPTPLPVELWPMKKIWKKKNYQKIKNNSKRTLKL